MARQECVSVYQNECCDGIRGLWALLSLHMHYNTQITEKRWAEGLVSHPCVRHFKLSQDVLRHVVLPSDPPRNTDIWLNALLASTDGTFPDGQTQYISHAKIPPACRKHQHKYQLWQLTLGFQQREKWIKCAPDLFERKSRWCFL